MAAVSNNVRTPKPDRRPTKPVMEAMEETVEVALEADTLKKVLAAALAKSQTPGEWIHEAVVEAVERRTTNSTIPGKSRH